MTTEDQMRCEAQRYAMMLNWAISRWHAEVANRPLQNIHRRSLDDTWRQVIRYLGGNDVSLCGPPHDELRSKMHDSA